MQGVTPPCPSCGAVCGTAVPTVLIVLTSCIVNSWLEYKLKQQKSRILFPWVQRSLCCKVFHRITGLERTSKTTLFQPTPSTRRDFFPSLLFLVEAREKKEAQDCARKMSDPPLPFPSLVAEIYSQKQQN